jgi:hypothetical protein
LTIYTGSVAVGAGWGLGPGGDPIL